MGSSSPAHQLEAYLGVVPREFNSGDGQHRGAITKAGPGRARRLSRVALQSANELTIPMTFIKSSLVTV